MGKNKKNWFVRFDNWLQKYLDRVTKRKIGLYNASPIGYPLFNSFIMLFFLLFFVSLFVITLWFMSIMIKPVPFEIEGSCNTGFIGIDFSERFVFNESSQSKKLLSYNPQKLNLKNINGLNCNFKAKGAIPLNKLLQVNW